MSWEQFFHMGGYAEYVWPVYVIAAVILVFNVIQPLVQRRRVLKRLRRYLRVKQKAS